jgi:ATP-binding protein involved in chromosome partitioning
VAAQRSRIAARLASVRATVAVMSGKGGVGKSAVTAALASCAARHAARRIGVVDGDLKSPTVARLLGVRGPLRVSEGGVHPAETSAGIRVMSTSLLLEDGAPLAWHEHHGERFVWRGVLEAGALREFLGDVVWGTLDLLLVDLPPGADRLTDLVELYPGLTGALVVTIPSDESHASVRRAMRTAQTAGIPLLGVVENMSGYACVGCASTQPLFAGDAGERLADEFAVPLLARLPFRPARHDVAAHIAPDGSLEETLAALLPPEPVLP